MSSQYFVFVKLSTLFSALRNLKMNVCVHWFVDVAVLYGIHNSHGYEIRIHCNIQANVCQVTAFEQRNNEFAVNVFIFRFRFSCCKPHSLLESDYVHIHRVPDYGYKTQYSVFFRCFVSVYSNLFFWLVEFSTWSTKTIRTVTLLIMEVP